MAAARSRTRLKAVLHFLAGMAYERSVLPFVRFSDHHQIVCFASSCFRPIALRGRKRSATQTNTVAREDISGFLVS